MSQVSIIDIEGNHPQIPTQFNANVGFAIPIANVLEIYGDTQLAGSTPVHTEGSGNNITTYVQLSQAIAGTDATKVGLAAFNSSQFTVDANGFVGLIGGGAGIDSVATQVGGPIFPDGTGQISILGSIAASSGNPLRSNGTVANTVTLIAQTASAQAATNINFAGMSSFDSTQFNVDGNGYVTLAGGGLAIDEIAVDASTGPGTNPVLPTGAGQITVTGAQVAAGTVGANVIRSNSLAANTYTIQIQRSTAVAGTASLNNGVSHFDSAAFDVDANGFVQLNGGGIAATSFDVQANTAPGTDPVVPTAAGAVTVNGAAVANHSVVLETRSRAANAYNLEIQYATSAAATDATKSGVAHFDSTDFTVDANGFVALAGAGAGQTITGDSGGALVPSGGNWNILGGPGVTTTGSGSTLTINSVVYTDQGGTTSVLSDSGSFATAAITLTLPAAPAQGELCEFVCTTANALVIDAPSTHLIRIGSLITSAGGTATSTAIGDALVLRYRSSTTTWHATSVIGTWLIA